MLSAPMLWWLGFGLLVAAELASGTFYLLMLSVGCVAGAVAAHLELPRTAQIAAAAVLGIAATVGWHLKRSRAPHPVSAESNPDLSLDIGQTVHVTAWAEDATARVHYRGAPWTVQYAGPGTPAPGDHVVVAILGSVLRVAPAAPRN